jgi:hypothetical protein
VRAQAFVQHLSSVPAGRAPDKGGRDAPGGTPLATVSGVRSSCDTMPMNAALAPSTRARSVAGPGVIAPKRRFANQLAHRWVSGISAGPQAASRERSRQTRLAQHEEGVDRDHRV